MGNLDGRNKILSFSLFRTFSDVSYGKFAVICISSWKNDAAQAMLKDISHKALTLSLNDPCKTLP